MNTDPPVDPEHPYLNPLNWRITYYPDDDAVIDLDY